MTPHTLDESDLFALLSTGDLDHDEDVDEHSSLRRLSRRISGQYVEVVATFASQSLAGRTSPGLQRQVLIAADALVRLAHASQDHELLAVLAELPVLLDQHSKRQRGSRQAFVDGMHAWLPRLAAFLDAEDAERLTTLVQFDRRASPLLGQLAALRGMGPRRLERLYCAGLFTVDALIDADPTEVSQATGLPSALATEVVDAAKQFAIERPRTAAVELSRRAVEMREALLVHRTRGQRDPEVDRAIHDALRELQVALQMLQAEPPGDGGTSSTPTTK